MDWNLIGHGLNFLAVVAIGGAGLRRLGRMEQRLDTLWAWFNREHDLSNGSKA